MLEIPIITPATLRKWLKKGQKTTILDVRPLSQTAGQSIPQSTQLDIYDKLKTGDKTAFDGLLLDPTLPVVVFCASGGLSKFAVEILLAKGYDAYSLEGGLNAWTKTESPLPRLGLHENIHQFALLVLVNAFVGGMVGLERTLLPLLAKDKFGITSSLALLSFIGAFGAAKAGANYLTGKLSNRLGRKNLLVLGWILALPIPFLLGYAPTWGWVIAANVLLGIHQGFAWSSTVVMKIDLVGERQRGLAMGLNEFAGYVAVAVAAFGSAWLAQRFGASDVIFYAGLAIALIGLLLSAAWVRDTRKHVATESAVSCREKLPHLFAATTWQNKNLSSVTQAGLVNNLNDGMIWGLLPLLMHQQGYSLSSIGLVAGLYPFIWGITQVFTGKWSDTVSKKALLVLGMLLQSIGIVGFLWAGTIVHYTLCSVLLGLGTAAVYPVFLSAVADNTHPDQRAESIGIFRLWRDLGYLFGALLTGLLSDWAGTGTAIAAVGGLTAFSALVIHLRMTDIPPCDATSLPVSIGRFKTKQS